MPSNATTGAAAAGALALGALAGALVQPGPPERPLCVSPPGRAVAAVEADVEHVSVGLDFDGGGYVARVPRRQGGEVVEVVERTPQYVADALAACDAYEAEKGAICPRRAEWEAVAVALRAQGVALPPARGR